MFLKNSRAVNGIQGYVIFGQIAPILRQKEIFSENNKDYFFLSIVPHHATKRQRDRQKVNHEKGCIILAQIALIAIAQKGIFLVNWLILLWSHYCTPSYYISNFLESESWDKIALDIKLHNLDPNWAQIDQLH